MPTINEIVHEIQYSIMIGNFLPKQRLVELELAQRYSVSRTMIRESLRILEDRGSVVTHSNKGAMVNDLSAKEIRDIYFLRTRLERIASILAYDHLYQTNIREMENLQKSLRKSDRIDLEAVKTHEEFHEIIYRAAGNEVLAAEIKRLIVLSGPIRYRAYISPSRRNITLGGHDEIINALRDKDRQTFLEVSHNHVFGSLKFYLRSFYPIDAEELIDEYKQMVASIF